MKRTTLVAVTVCLVMITAGCGASQTSNTNTATDTAESPPTTTPTTPETETPADPGTPTTTPETPEQGLNYTAEFIRLLESDSVDISTLNASYNGSDYDGSAINFKSAGLESYGDGNQKRLRINISAPDQQNLKRSLNATYLFYAHVLETAHKNGDAPAFDEIVVYSHQNDELTARTVMNEYMMLFYLKGWDSREFMVGKWVSGTTDLYQDGSFVTGASPELRDRIQGATTANGTILRINQVGKTVLVDYTTTTDPDNGARRTAELAKIAHAYGESIANTELTYDSAALIIEERYASENGTYDLRGWTTVNYDDARDYARDQMSAGEILNIIENRYLYEDNYLNR